MRIPVHEPHRLLQHLRSNDQVLLLPAWILLVIGILLALWGA